MFGTTKSALFAYIGTGLSDRDVSWYGTLGLLAASLGAMAILVFTL